MPSASLPLLFFRLKTVKGIPLQAPEKNLGLVDIDEMLAKFLKQHMPVNIVSMHVKKQLHEPADSGLATIGKCVEDHCA